jgi:hypothetical protein
MGPLFTPADQWSFVIALIIGIAFGYILESSGFSSSRKLAGVFYGYDFVVLQVFFTAALTSMIGLIYFDYLGWIDMNAVFVNQYFIGSAIVGGIIMGFGFVIGGFCPGTSACAAAIGKIDAMIFIGGVVLGAMIFDFAHPLYAKFMESGNLGTIKIYESLHISKNLFVILFIIFAVAAFSVTAVIQKKVADSSKKY